MGGRLILTKDKKCKNLWDFPKQYFIFLLYGTTYMYVLIYKTQTHLMDAGYLKNGIPKLCLPLIITSTYNCTFNNKYRNGFLGIGMRCRVILLVLL